jgi:hypothetical protein
VQDDEQVVVVRVDLRALVAREEVLVVEGMEVEVLLEIGAVDRTGALDVELAQAVGLEDLDLGRLGLRLRGDREVARTGGPAQAGARKARHGDFAGRRSWASFRSSR